MNARDRAAAITAAAAQAQLKARPPRGLTFPRSASASGVAKFG